MSQLRDCPAFASSAYCHSVVLFLNCPIYPDNAVASLPKVRCLALSMVTPLLHRVSLGQCRQHYRRLHRVIAAYRQAGRRYAAASDLPAASIAIAANIVTSSSPLSSPVRPSLPGGHRRWVVRHKHGRGIVSQHRRALFIAAITSRRRAVNTLNRCWHRHIKVTSPHHRYINVAYH